MRVLKLAVKEILLLRIVTSIKRDKHGGRDGEGGAMYCPFLQVKICLLKHPDDD